MWPSRDNCSSVGDMDLIPVEKIPWRGKFSSHFSIAQESHGITAWPPSWGCKRAGYNLVAKQQLDIHYCLILSHNHLPRLLNYCGE